MSGFICLIRGGFALTLCAAMSASIAHASPTFQSAERVDFGALSGTGQTSPLYTPEDTESAVVGLVFHPLVRVSTTTSHDFVDADLRTQGIADAPETLFSATLDLASIDAGQIEAIDGWTGLLETPTGWRTPSDQSTGDLQPGLFTAAVTDANSSEFGSYVSVIPLPGAFASAGATIGLIGVAWTVRRFRAIRSIH